jgi:quercetin dioxygenase-like cupin family protein
MQHLIGKNMKSNEVRKPFRKCLSEIPVEHAHGGSGSRQLILSAQDAVSRQLEAVTKGFLQAGGVFDWHRHDGVDEFFIVIAGTGTIEYADGTVFQYSSGDVIYNPSGLGHRIVNTGSEENQFYFVRLKD